MNQKQITPGQILECSWGYEQTNIDFYKVVKVSNGWATIQKMENVSDYSKGDNSAGWDMTSIEMPGAVKASAKPFRRKIKKSYYAEGPEYIKINSWGGYAEPWDGQPAHASHYA